MFGQPSAPDSAGRRIIARLGIVAATLLAFAGTTLTVPAMASAAPHDGNGSEVAPQKHQKKGKNKGKHGKKHHGHKKGGHKKRQGKK